MSVLKIRENKDLIEQDPFELFTADEPWAEHTPSKAKRKPFKKRPELIGLLLIVLAVVGVTSVVSVWSSKHSGGDRTQMPYAYLELRVIDMDGRPVAGATVSSKARAVGVTDSFGEWRRFMRVTLGSKLSLNVSKSIDGKTVKARKLLAIPAKAPEVGDLEVKGALQIGTSLDNLRPAPAPMTVAEPTVKQEEKKLEMIARAAELNYDRVWFYVEKPAAKIKSERSRKRAKELATLVLNSLKKRARQLGLKVDPGASWKIKLQHLATKPKGKSNVYGLIQVSSLYEGNLEYSFLRNYATMSLATARSVLWSITRYAKKNYRLYKSDGRYLVRKPKSSLWYMGKGNKVLNDAAKSFTILGNAANGDYLVKTPVSNPCGSEGKCWVYRAGVSAGVVASGKKLKTMRIFGVKEGTDVFVGGYKAKNLKGDVWEYQGAKKAQANVTAVNDGKVVYRGSITARTGKRAILSIPTSSISLR